MPTCCAHSQAVCAPDVTFYFLARAEIAMQHLEGEYNPRSVSHFTLESQRMQGSVDVSRTGYEN